MKKFWHVIYIIVMRILFFVLLLAMSPMWILFGIFLAFSVIFGQADDFIDPDYYDNDRKKTEKCPEYVEKVDQLENDIKVPTNN